MPEELTLLGGNRYCQSSVKSDHPQRLPFYPSYDFVSARSGQITAIVLLPSRPCTANHAARTIDKCRLPDYD
ncbi:hypothetical protein NXT3_PC00651 (plasmid) [Sinorhizobium fredii]|uniref:Uncharacterized protein n=1 Tax=Rhizobium fredii TaxID=380 RepID=A0A2L0HF76_RHIFR|nr:hypothetical protein NXT3_PC00651 [Sinorhizobium fredii]